MESDISCVLQQLCAIDSRAEAASTLLEMLESCVILSVSDKLSGTKRRDRVSDLLASGLPLSQVVEAMGKVFQGSMSPRQVQMMSEGTRLCVEVTLLYTLPWPCRLLTKLAQADQWLLFLVVGQVFNFPKAEVLKVTESFSSIALREHMVLALTHICYYRERTERVGRSARSKRSALYSKIGINSREGSPSSSQSGEERCRSSSPSDVDGSVLDDALSFTTTETNLDLGVDTWLARNPKDLFSILLTCHQQENPAGELVTAAATLSLPVLAVFAACYDRHIPGLCLSVWLYTQLPHRAKLSLHQKLAKETQASATGNKAVKGPPPLQRKNCCRACDISVLDSGPREQKLLILAHVMAGSVEVVSEGLKVFDQHSSLYYLTLAIQEARGVCNQEHITQLLADSASATNSEPEVDQPCASVGSQWVTAMAQDIIAMALDEYITNSHQQCHLLSALAAVSQLPPFCSHSVNWALVGQLCEVVGQARYKISFKKLLWTFEAGEVKDIAKRIVEGLREKRCFSEALQVCQLVDLPVFTIVCGQLRAEFENSKLSIRSNYTGLELFLCRGHKQLCEKAVPPEHACTFFTSISEEVPLFAMQYLCMQYALVWCYKAQGDSHSHSTSLLQPQGSHSPSQHIPYSPSPQDTLFPHLHITQSGDPSQSLVSKLEHKMWKTYIQSHCNREAEAAGLSVTLPEGLGRWPWEGESGTSCLDMGQVLKTAGLTHAFLTLTLADLGDDPVPGVKNSRSAWRRHTTTREGATAGKARDEGSPNQGNIGDEHDETISGQEGGGTTHEEEDRRRVVQELVDMFMDRGMLVTACRVLSSFGETSKVSRMICDWYWNMISVVLFCSGGVSVCIVSMLYLPSSMFLLFLFLFIFMCMCLFVSLLFLNLFRNVLNIFFFLFASKPFFCFVCSEILLPFCTYPLFYFLSFPLQLFFFFFFKSFSQSKL